jgi:uncharacterized protein (TIGR02001 family)
MKKFLIPAAVAVAMTSAPALAADMGGKMVTKGPAPVVVSPWDIAFGAAIASDYNFRGISQSDRGFSPSAYFEPRYNVSKNLQFYAGIGGLGVDLASNPSAEIDLYAGVRPTFGALALDLGFIYYWYPSEKGHSTDPTQAPTYPNGNTVLPNTDFWELYAKATYTVNDNFAIGGNIYWSPSWLKSGADGTYASVTAKYTGAPLSNGWGWFVSGEFGHYWLGTPDADPFVFTAPVADLPNYSTWNAGLAFTYKVFTLDFRYYDTDLSKEECNYLTADPSAVGGGTPVPGNAAGLRSNWCSAAFIVKLSADLTLDSLK